MVIVSTRESVRDADTIGPTPPPVNPVCTYKTADLTAATCTHNPPIRPQPCVQTPRPHPQDRQNQPNRRRARRRVSSSLVLCVQIGARPLLVRTLSAAGVVHPPACAYRRPSGSPAAVPARAGGRARAYRPAPGNPTGPITSARAWVPYTRRPVGQENISGVLYVQVVGGASPRVVRTFGLHRVGGRGRGVPRLVLRAGSCRRCGAIDRVAAREAADPVCRVVPSAARRVRSCVRGADVVWSFGSRRCAPAVGPR